MVDLRKDVFIFLPAEVIFEEYGCRDFGTTGERWCQSGERWQKGCPHRRWSSFLNRLFEAHAVGWTSKGVVKCEPGCSVSLYAGTVQTTGQAHAQNNIKHEKGNFLRAPWIQPEYSIYERLPGRETDAAKMTEAPTAMIRKGISRLATLPYFFVNRRLPVYTFPPKYHGCLFTDKM